MYENRYFTFHKNCDRAIKLILDSHISHLVGVWQTPHCLVNTPLGDQLISKNLHLPLHILRIYG